MSEELFEGLPEVGAYLKVISKNPLLAELFDIEKSGFASFEANPYQGDWADFNGLEFIDQLWIDASGPKEQRHLARISHLRALAWRAVHERFLDD